MADMTNILCCLLTRAHFAGVHTGRPLWSHVSYALDAAMEESSPQDLVSRVLKACIQHPLSSLAPRDPLHDVSVLQWLGKAWQTRGWPVPEVLTSNASAEPDDSPELCYKTYMGWGFGNGSGCGEESGCVTLLESRGGIIHHTTGLTTWGGAAILANWVTDNPELISGRKVLELGAGVGFTASVILTNQDKEHPPPVSYTATDCHHHVLTLLHHNLELNLREQPMKREELQAFQEATGKILVSEEVQAGQILPWKPPSSSLRLSSKSCNITPDDGSLGCQTMAGTKVDVLQVDWRQPCALLDADVILAADVVYAHHLIPPLVALIKSILNGTSSKASTIKKTKVRRSKSGGRIKDKERYLKQMDEDNKKQEDLAAGEVEEEEEEKEKEEAKMAMEKQEKEKRAEDVERVAYIACTRRNHETMSLFIEEVAKQGLVHSLVYQATLDTDAFLFVYNETHQPIKIYKIVLPQKHSVRKS